MTNALRLENDGVITYFPFCKVERLIVDTNELQITIHMKNNSFARKQFYSRKEFERKRKEFYKAFGYNRKEVRYQDLG